MTIPVDDEQIEPPDHLFENSFPQPETQARTLQTLEPKIIDKLRCQNLPLDFRGRKIYQFAITDLRNLCTALDIARGSVKSKSELCVAIMSEVQTNPPTASEQAVLSAMLRTKNPKAPEAARWHLRLWRRTDKAERQWLCLEHKPRDLCGHTGRTVQAKATCLPATDFPAATFDESEHNHWEFFRCITCLKAYIEEYAREYINLTSISCPETFQFGTRMTYLERPCCATLDNDQMQYAELPTYELYLTQILVNHGVPLPNLRLNQASKIEPPMGREDDDLQARQQINVLPEGF